MIHTDWGHLVSKNSIAAERARVEELGGWTHKLRWDSHLRPWTPVAWIFAGNWRGLWEPANQAFWTISMFLEIGQGYPKQRLWGYIQESISEHWDAEGGWASLVGPKRPWWWFSDEMCVYKYFHFLPIKSAEISLLSPHVLNSLPGHTPISGLVHQPAFHRPNPFY